MKNKKIMILNFFFIFLILLNILNCNVLATENVVFNETYNQEIKLCCDTPEQKAIVIIQVILSFLAYILWVVSIYKLIKKDKKKAIILAIIGLISFFICGFLGIFKCA